MKIQAPSFAEDKIANNIVKTQDANLLNPSINCQIDQRIPKDNSNLFAKISLTHPPKILSSILQFYEVPLEQLTE